MQRKYFLTLFAVLAILTAAIPIASAAPVEIAAPAPAQSSPAAPAAQPETVASAILRLNQGADGDVTVSYRAATGLASFVRVSKGGDLMPAASGESAEAKSLAFLADYGAAFGIQDVTAQLISVGSQVDAQGATRLAYTQVHQGVPVFGSYLYTRVAADGALTAVNAVTVPGIKVSTVPTLSPEKAGAIAVAAAGGPERGALVSSDVQVQGSQLLVFRENLVQDVAGGADHLVYEVEVGNGSSVRWFIYVDAHTGAVVDRIDGIEHGQEAPDALSRQISESSLANVVWTNPPDPDPIPGGWAGGTAQQVIDWNNEADGAKETYNLFGSMAGWDSYNNAGAQMRTVNNDPGISCPNANWNGTSTNYCTGVTSDDVVAHEWGHAYTDYTSSLIYQWQSGAMNESYSDIWGEVVDLINGRQTDVPGGPRQSDGAACSVFGAGAPSTDNTYRWLMGEDSTAFGGAIRDMWRPECYNDPGKVTSPSYFCGTGDGGGVHTNSGVPNHTFALLVDGGTSNGQTVSALGLTKTAHIFWQAQSVYLGPASNFADLADALEQSCTDLTGVNLNGLSTSNATPAPSGQIISAADCQEVADAVAASELRTPPTQCNFQPLLDPNAPALCAGQGTGVVEPIVTEDWEGGVLPAGWTVGTFGVANPATFDTPDWAVVNNLPAGANGTYSAFVADLIIGDCAADDESGALYLQSPAIVIPAGADVPRVAIDHWVATELGWDGGNVKVSVNGGPFTLVPDAAFEFNDYNQNLNTAGAGNTNPMAGQPAFTGTDGGSVGGSWGQSQVNLAGLAGPGDSVVFRFDFGVDGCNGVIGWYVDDVQVYSCEGEGGGLQCGNSVLDPGEQCDDGNTSNGDGCSSTCQVESGWTCTDPIPGGNVVADPSFEAGTPNPSWTEASTNFGTPLCTIAGCGTGTGTGPHTGDWWAWFGGIATYEAGSVSQSVTMPSGGSATLDFWVEQFVCSGAAADYLEVNMDGNQVWVTTAADPACGTLGYRQVSVDVSAYANGAPHTLEFNSEVFGSANTNFFVDDVNIPGGAGTPSVCTPTGGGGTVTFCSNLTAPLPIPDSSGGVPGSVSNDIVVPDDISITDLNFYVDASHTWVGDLKFVLERVDSTTTTTPIDRPGVPASTFGCSGDNYDVTIDDEGTDGNVETTCLGAPPAIAGSLVGGDPANTSLLTAYDGLSTQATWRLTITDNAGGDTGALNQWCIEVPAPAGQCPAGPEVGELTASDPVFNRPVGFGGSCSLSGVGTAVHYDVYSYYLTGPTPHDLFASLLGGTTMDTVLVFYQAGDGSQNPFDPSQGCLNSVAYNDDFGSTLQSQISATNLGAGWVDVVVTTFDNGVTGAYTMDVSSQSCQAGGGTPNIDVNPLSMASTQAANTTTQQQLTVANTGNADLTWTIAEENLSAPDLILPKYPAASDDGAYEAAKAAAQPVTIGDNILSAAGSGVGQTATPSRPATPDGMVTITHSNSQAITALNSVSCNAGGLHTNNSYIRVFDLAAFGLTNGLDVTEVQFGIEEALGGTGSQPVTVNLYTKTNPAGPLTFANLTPIGSANVNVSDQSLTILSVPVTGSAPAGSILVVEVFTPNGQSAGNSFFIGSNALGQTAPTYLAAADCGVPEPTDTAALGFPGMHVVMNVTGDADVTPQACSAPADIPWLSLDTTAGTTAGGASTPVQVTFDSTGLAAGVYNGNLCIDSNDPDAGPGNGTDLVVVPVELTVTAPSNPAISVVKTVGTVPGVCAATSNITVPAGTTVYYCYTVTNTGDVTLNLHDLSDDVLGTIFTGLNYALTPGSSIDTVAAGLSIPYVANAPTTNTATWTAYNAGGPSVTATATATVDVVYMYCNMPTEGFENGVPSMGWTVVDNVVGGATWGDIASCGASGSGGNWTGGSGNAACMSPGSTAPFPYDAELRSPMFSLVGQSAASLTYLANYQNWAGIDRLNLDISNDGGATWTNLKTWNSDQGAFQNTPGVSTWVNLAPWVGQSGLMLRWHYFWSDSNALGWYAQVDNVNLSCTELPPTAVTLGSLSTAQAPLPAAGLPLAALPAVVGLALGAAYALRRKE